MKFITRLVVGLAIFAACLHAQEEGAHLEPEAGYLFGYSRSDAYLIAVRDVLVREAARSPAMMVTLPSSSPESIVYLEQRAGRTFVVSRTANAQIWSAEQRDQVTVSRKEKRLSADIADEIGTVFALAVSQSQYPKEERLGMDGVSYHFSAFANGAGVRAGQTWSPDPRTTCGRLVALGEHLQGYVRGEITGEKLQSEARDLLRILKKNA